jgi:hypothetical protein
MVSEIGDLTRRLNTERKKKAADAQEFKWKHNALRHSFIFYRVAQTQDVAGLLIQAMGARKMIITGNPDCSHVSTSRTERQNLSMRMGMRRFTRLTNAFSKKIENHEHMVALYFMHYNFCQIH